MTTAPTRPVSRPRPRFSAGELLTVLKEAAQAFGQDKAPRLAAAIAYYAMFSIAPLLLFAVVIAGRFLTNDAVVDQLFGPAGMLAQNLGADAATFLRTLIPKEDALHKGTLIASIIGFVTLFMGATGLFVQLQDALNSMWGADPAPKQGVIQMVKTRLVSFVMILLIGVLLFVFLGVNTYLSAIATDLGARFGVGAFLVRLLTFGLSALFLTPVFAAIFKFLPTLKLEWREVLVGGAITAVLFTAGQIAIGIYFGRAAPGSAFGAAGTLVALLLWIYYSGMIFFFGAESTWVYSQKFGSQAGGAANSAKKMALAEKGAAIDPTPSAQERSAPTNGGPVRDSRGRVIGLSSADGSPQGPAPAGTTRWPFRRRTPRPRKVARAPSLLPSLGGALWNALSALLAIPTVLVLRLVGLHGKTKK
ncbi:YihY/virulence factor BrkB family protein [Deinococcus navajonensis]|uniref:YihY/virulence factor BrkB family protein n=1 Tax=Deinococcus navajonensis TaxID=309884 RepID=A0ABV8XPY1_9DEIO